MGAVHMGYGVRSGLRLAYRYADGAQVCGFEVSDGPGHVVDGGVSDGFACCDIPRDEGGVGFCDRITGFLVEAARSLIHRYGQGDVCAVLSPPIVDPVLECGSDSGVSVGGFYANFMGGQRPLAHQACFLIKSHAYDVLGFLLCSSYQGCRYQIACLPYPYKTEGQTSSIRLADDGLWSCYEVLIREMFGEHSADGIYFFLRAGRVDAELFPMIFEHCDIPRDEGVHGVTQSVVARGMHGVAHG